MKYRNPRILIVFKCHRLLRQSKQGEEDGGVHYDQVIDECKKNNSTIMNIEQLTQRRNSSMPHIGRLTNGHQFWQKVEDRRKFQYCVNPNYPQKFLYHRAIQGHSGSTINPALQDNVLLPEGFTEEIYHVGNGKELRSTVRHGLIPGGVSLKTGRQAVFFTVVNPMDNQDGFGKTLCDLSKARIAPYKIIGNAFKIEFFGAI